MIFGAGTEENAGHEGTTPYHPTNFGRPDAWLNSTSGAALGIVALDDAFRAHGQARNFAVEKMNERTPGTCQVSDPASGIRHRAVPLPRPCHPC